MPQGAYQECRHPLYRNYAVRGGYCRAHATARPSWFRSDLTPANKRFRKLRHSFLVRHPLCNGCKLEPATVLDHVIPHRGDARLFWDQRNWQGLCVRCHGLKTARELWGRGRWANHGPRP
jgi:5-methylcytosine-specific restriction protein A